MLSRHRESSEALIQVCADLSDYDTRTRELRALTAAGDAHPRATRLLLTLAREMSNVSSSRSAVVRPVYEWLLESVG